MPEDNDDKKIEFAFGFVKWIVSTVIIALIVWCLSIEVRLQNAKSDHIKELSDRVANLETALSPVLIEYGVQQELAKRMAATPPAASAPPKTGPSKEELTRLRMEEKSKIQAQYPNLAK